MISVILCTYNRDKYIYNVLKSVAENDFPHSQYEIVLVNNNSTDTTESECQRFMADYPDIRFRYCVEKSQGLSYARNCGIRQSEGDLLVYVDDDATVNKEYLGTYARFFAEHPDAVAAGGPILPVYETQEPAWTTHYTRQLITGKRVFDTIGLFNVELGRKGNSLIGAEEKDLFDKMTTNGMHFYYLPTAILYHIIPPHKLTQDYFDRLTYGIGVSERYRTLQISRKKYLNRLAKEAVKWGGTLVLWCSYALRLQFAKGNKLVAFRRNVTRGLLTPQKSKP